MYSEYSEIDGLMSHNKELEELVSKLNKEKFCQRAEHEKEIAILDQKMQLYEEQLTELKAQQEEGKNAQQSLLNVLKGMEEQQESSKDNVNEMIKYQRSTQLEELRKLEEEDYAAIILARAGVERLGWADKIDQVLDKNEFQYAPAQGSLAVQ